MKQYSSIVSVTYYYNGSLLFCEKDEAGNLQKVYINDGEGIIGMVRYIYDSGNTFSHYQRMYYLYDSLGSVSLITSESGMPSQEYYYTPYGSTSNVEYGSVNNLRFIGRYGGYKDDDAGLTYFWHRWYDEGDGRWVSRDPIKDCKNKESRYKYSANRPITHLDIWGLKSQLCCRNLTTGIKVIDIYQHCYIVVDGDSYSRMPEGYYINHPSDNPENDRCEDLPGDKEECLKNAFESEKEMDAPYNPLSDNSNTSACRILRRCGIQTKLPSNAPAGDCKQPPYPQRLPKCSGQ